MKKIACILTLILSLAATAQKTKKAPLIEFAPDFRFGAQVPVYFGNNYFSNDFESSTGIQSTLSLAKFKNFRLTIGFDYHQLKLKNIEPIGDFSHVNIKTLSFMIEYEKRINKFFTISPTVSLGFCDLNYVDQGIIAVQHGNEIKTGAYVSRSLNKTFAAFAGVHYAYFFNSNLTATPENKDYFGKSNKVVFSVGIQIH